MLRMIYHAPFHSILSYDIIYWRNSSYSSIILKIQKIVISTMMRCGYGKPCGKLFVELKILPLASQYVLYLLLLVVNNRNYFTPNSNCNCNLFRIQVKSTEQVKQTVGYRKCPK
jgi:hypothetical protein